MRGVIVLLCFALAGCRGKQVVTEMTDTTKVMVDSVAFVLLRQSVGFAVDSCVEWTVVEFGDSGGWLRIDGGRLAAGGVKGFQSGRKSGEMRLDFAGERLDSAAVKKTENRGATSSEMPQTQNGKTDGWLVYCLVFGVLLVGAMWCLWRKLCGLTF